MLNQIQIAADPLGLIIMGVVHDKPGSVVLLGAGPGFWPVFVDTPEFVDGTPHPIDRWSKRVIGALAVQFNGSCVFPSDGPPYPPFIRWSLDTGRFFQSPVGMMVHDTMGMMISLRGALVMNQQLSLNPPSPNPCTSCATQPCTTACPVHALSGTKPYDLTACHGFLDTSQGQSCMTQGCASRRACPISAGAKRANAQSAFHMLSFHPA